MNGLILLGAALVLTGLALAVVYFVRTLAAVGKRARYRRVPFPKDGSVWAGAVEQKQVYVPGTILRRFATTVAALLLAAAGAVPAVIGLELEREYVKVSDQSLVGYALVRPAGEGGVTVVYRERGEVAKSGVMPGRSWSAIADYVVFGPELESLGLTAFVRVIQIQTFERNEDILANRPAQILLVRDRHRITHWIERYLKGAKWVRVERRFSQPRRGDEREQTLYADKNGLSTSFHGR